MNLYINAPAYFSSVHGTEDAVYRYQQYVSRHMDIRQYTRCLDTIGIAPIIAPEKEYAAHRYTETKLVHRKARMASLSLRMHYEQFLNASALDRIQMLADNILASFRVIKKRLGKDFDLPLCEAQLKALTNKFLEEYWH